MMQRMITIAGAALALIAVAEPAMAQVRPLPEPATMSLFGLGLASAFVAKRFIRRK